MLVGHRPASLPLDDQRKIEEEVGKVFSKHGAVLVEHFEWELWLHGQSGLAQAVKQTVFVNLLQVTRSQVAVQGETGFANKVAQGKHVVLRAHDDCSL